MQNIAAKDDIDDKPETLHDEQGAYDSYFTFIFSVFMVVYDDVYRECSYHLNNK